MWEEYNGKFYFEAHWPLHCFHSKTVLHDEYQSVTE